jgi:general secretion pathway protein H
MLAMRSPRRPPIPPHQPPPPSARSGFTLIELLVVAVIVAVLAGALVLAVGLGSGPGAPEREARRIERLLLLACERAVLGGRDHGLALHRDGYGFVVRGSSGWMPLSGGADAVLAPRVLPDGVALDLERDGRALRLPDQPPAQPQLGCVASGELTPFVLRVTRGDEVAWRVLGEYDGRVRAAPEGP